MIIILQSACLIVSICNADITFTGAREVKVKKMIELYPVLLTNLNEVEEQNEWLRKAMDHQEALITNCEQRNHYYRYMADKERKKKNRNTTVGIIIAVALVLANIFL